MKLISLNIEGHRHLESRVLPFLKDQQSDVICLQEVFEVDVPNIEKTLGIKGHYLPLANVAVPTPHLAHTLGNWGLYVCSKWPIEKTAHSFYKGQADRIPIFFENHDPNSLNRAVLWSEVRVGENMFVVATTHFTWSPQGQPTLEQHQRLDQLFRITRQLSPHILCGDFNAPRGGEIFSRLVTEYHDNIPTSVTTTLDGQFHKAGSLEYVVDGMFSHDDYEISDVKVVAGVSDHMAIVGEVELKV